MKTASARVVLAVIIIPPMFINVSIHSIILTNKVKKSFYVVNKPNTVVILHFYLHA